MERFACVYVVRDHLGFYTEPTVTAVKDGENLNDVVHRVLMDDWHWEQGRVSTMIGLRQIKSFFVHPGIVEVIDIIENKLDQVIGFNMTQYSTEKTELKVLMCEALKEEL
jgi:asparagine synthetase A